MPRMGVDVVGSIFSYDVNFLSVCSQVVEFLLVYWNWCMFELM